MDSSRNRRYEQTLRQDEEYPLTCWCVHLAWAGQLSLHGWEKYAEMGVVIIVIITII
jgi:hypothetical protein